MVIQQATRTKTKLRLGLCGLAGSGKTYSSLLLAYGLCGDWGKIALIDTEENSASFCRHLGPFQTVQLAAPFHSPKFEEAILLCEDAGMEVIIIDSLSAEWSGDGGASQLLRGADREEALRNHRIVLSNISESTCHLLCTMRARRRIVCEDQEGKRYSKQLEIPDQQEGIEYLFTTFLHLDQQQKAHVVKDRTGVLQGREPFPLDTEVGTWLFRWCEQEAVQVPEHLQQRIDACQTNAELLQLLMTDEVSEVEYVSAFTKRRLELMGLPAAASLLPF